jgi:hypothetical protein
VARIFRQSWRLCTRSPGPSGDPVLGRVSPGPRASNQASDSSRPRPGAAFPAPDRGLPRADAGETDVPSNALTAGHRESTVERKAAHGAILSQIAALEIDPASHEPPTAGYLAI